MGGGGGLGLFKGTHGARNNGSGDGAGIFSGGTLVAAAVNNTLTDAGGEVPVDNRTFWRKLLDSGLPIWTFEYGHPEKTRRIEGAKRQVEPLLKGYTSAHEWGIFDFKNWLIQEGVKSFGRSRQKNKK